MKTEKLEAKEARFLSIEDQLSDPSVIANQTKWRALSKEHAELSEIVQKFREYKEANKRCQDLKDILGDNDMKELHDLAKEELKEATEEIVCLEKEIRVLLIPKDPNDNRNVILEIRAGTGGDEAALFAADLQAKRLIKNPSSVPKNRVYNTITAIEKIKKDFLLEFFEYEDIL